MANTPNSSVFDVRPADSKPVAKKPFAFSGRVGGAFNIEGEGFGDNPGTLLIGNYHVAVTSWRDHLLKGQLPEGIPNGPISVNGKQVGVYPPPPPPPVVHPPAVVTPSGVQAAPGAAVPPSSPNAEKSALNTPGAAAMQTPQQKPGGQVTPQAESAASVEPAKPQTPQNKPGGQTGHGG